MEVGQQIKELRISKGFSQEELSNQAGISLRTLQRLEKGETIARGNTLQVICAVLNINVEELNVITTKEEGVDTSKIKLLYAVVFVGLILPLGNILAPLVVWLSGNRKDNRFNAVGKHIVLFQTLYTILSVGLTMYWIFFKLSKGGGSDWIMLITLLLSIANYAFTFYVLLQIGKQNKVYFYPLFKSRAASI